VNTESRTNAANNAIDLSTIGIGSYINLYNSGILTAFNNGIFTQPGDAN